MGDLDAEVDPSKEAPEQEQVRAGQADLREAAQAGAAGAGQRSNRH